MKEIPLSLLTMWDMFSYSLWEGLVQDMTLKTSSSTLSKFTRCSPYLSNRTNKALTVKQNESKYEK